MAGFKDRFGVAVPSGGQIRAMGMRSAISCSLLALLGVALAGCSTLRPTQKALEPEEYELRHPIKLADVAETLDIFISGHQIDRRQRQDVIEFAQLYTRSGRGTIAAAMPQGGNTQLLGQIRQALAEGGARGGLSVSSYPTDPSSGTAPIRLSFVRLQAKVDSECGVWPDDLAGSKDLQTWHNRPYHNLGCSYQSIFAAQVADPIDLVRSRAESSIDNVKLLNSIVKSRSGEAASGGNDVAGNTIAK